jgi:hypothetical protein
MNCSRLFGAIPMIDSNLRAALLSDHAIALLLSPQLPKRKEQATALLAGEYAR